MHGDYVPLLAGSMSRTMTTTMTSPIEYLRTSIQVTTKKVSPTAFMKDLWSRNRMNKIWTGVTPTLLRDVPFSAIYWGTYEYSRKRLKNVNTNDFLKNFGCGYTAGVLAAVVTNPIDVVKTRMQAISGNKQDVFFQSFIFLVFNDRCVN